MASQWTYKSRKKKERLKKFHGNGSSGYNEDDFKAMAVELNLIAALCAGVRAFCAASNLEVGLGILAF
jgi:hypothetical protein